MDYCCKLVFSLCSVMMLTGTCNGCYTNYNTCYNDFNDARISATSNNRSAITCNAAIDAVTCFKNDASNCTDSDTAPFQYVTYRNILTGLITDCKTAVCSEGVRNCNGQTQEAYKLIQPLIDGRFSNESVVDKYCQGMETGIQCFQELMSSCPPQQVNQTAVTYEALYSAWCSVKGHNPVVCTNKLRNCLNQTVEAFTLIRNGFLNESVVDKPCQDIETGLQCFRDLVPSCPSLSLAEQVNRTVQSYETQISAMCSVKRQNTASTTAPGCDGNDCNSGTMSVVSLMVIVLGVTLAFI